MSLAQLAKTDQTSLLALDPRRYPRLERPLSRSLIQLQIGSGSMGTAVAQQTPDSVLTRPPHSPTPYVAFLIAKWSDYCEGLFRDLAARSPEELAALVTRADLRPARLSVAAEVLGALEDPNLAVEPLSTLLKHDSAMVREAAVYGLSHYRRIERVAARLRRLAEVDQSPAVREAANEAVAGDD